MSMKQKGTDRGERHETGEHEPKGAKATDGSGEKHGKMINGVAMGKEDDLKGRHAGHVGRHEGVVGEFNEGRKETVCYHHSRKAYNGE